MHVHAKQLKHVQSVVEEAKRTAEINDISYNAAIKSLEKEEKNLEWVHSILRKTNLNRDTSE